MPLLRLNTYTLRGCRLLHLLHSRKCEILRDQKCQHCASPSRSFSGLFASCILRLSDAIADDHSCVVPHVEQQAAKCSYVCLGTPHLCDCAAGGRPVSHGCALCRGCPSISISQMPKPALPSACAKAFKALLLCLRQHGLHILLHRF